jgi:hypothetical protein
MQLDVVDKLTNMIDGRLCRTKDGIRIQHEQLTNLADIRSKLVRNIDDISQRKPYVEAKQVVEKIF